MAENGPEIPEVTRTAWRHILVSGSSRWRLHSRESLLHSKWGRCVGKYQSTNFFFYNWAFAFIMKAKNIVSLFVVVPRRIQTLNLLCFRFARVSVSLARRGIIREPNLFAAARDPPETLKNGRDEPRVLWSKFRPSQPTLFLLYQVIMAGSESWSCTNPNSDTVETWYNLS